MLDSKTNKIKTLKYIIFSRWFLHLAIVLLGLIQKFIGEAQFDPKLFVLLAVTYSYNLAYYIYLRKDINKITEKGLYVISLLQVLVDQIVYTFILYYTGGIESLSFLFYFLTIFIAILLFSEIEIIALTLLSGFFYVSVIILEYREIIPHQWRYLEDPGFFQNAATTFHNSATVLLIITFVAFFAAFIGRIIRSREEALKAETEKVNITLNNLMDGVVVLDSKNRIVLLNPTAGSILKVKIKQILNKKLKKELFTEELQPIIKYIIKCSEKKKDISKEISVRDDKEEIIFQVNCATLFDGQHNIRGFLTVIRNITREKELESLKSDFISVAAHQLRTPLATIKWLFKMLLEGDAGELNDKQRDLLNKGFYRNNEVIEIVNNLLDVTEIEEGKLPFKAEYYSLDKVLDQVYKNSKYNAKQKDITLTYKKPKYSLPLIKLDLQKMRICFQNLIDNAIKYTPSGGKVALNIGLEKKSIIVKVSDSGMGIEEEQKVNLFTKFFRSKRAISEEPTGSGLGLYIVQNIVKMHGGVIWFESEVNKGTTFFIKMPLTKDIYFEGGELEYKKFIEGF